MIDNKKTENTEYFLKKVPRYRYFGTIFEKVPSVPVSVLKKYRGTVPGYFCTRYCPPLLCQRRSALFEDWQNLRKKFKQMAR